MGNDKDDEVKLNEFDLWLKKTLYDFKNLNLERKMVTIQGLLDVTPKNQRYFLVNLVRKYFPDNFFVLLPTELQEHICGFLDVESLLTACQVSKEWNVIISSLQSVWNKKYMYMNVGSTAQCNVNWKKKCEEALQFCKGVNDGSLFHHHDMSAECVSLVQITVLDYFGGLLAGGAESVVGVWNMKNYELMTTFQVPSRISCLDLSDEFIIVGHSTGRITVWNFVAAENPINLALHKELRSHTGVILCLSFCSGMNILASGASDSSVKLWGLSTGVLLKTLVNYTHWIVQTTLLPPTFNSEFFSLVTVSKDCVNVSSLQIELKDTFDPKITEAARTEHQLNSYFNSFIPGIHIVGDNLIYIDCWSPNNDEESWNHIVFRNMMPDNNFRRLLAPFNVRKLLAVGEKLALLLLQSDVYSKINLVVLELKSGKEIGGCSVPHSSSSSPNHPQIAVGEVQWLNDCSLLKPNSLIVALGISHGQIRIVRWKEFK